MPVSVESMPSESDAAESIDALLEKAESTDTSIKSKCSTRKCRFSFLHAVFLISYGFAWMILIRPHRLSRPYGLNLISSPARKAVIYEPVVFENAVDGVNDFWGEPSPAVDAAWSSILKYRNVAVPRNELDAIGRQSIALSDGSDRVVINLDVFHSLYCLNFIRESIFDEYYKSKDSKATQRNHVSQCLADLLSALRCHADVSMETYRWMQGRLLPYGRFDIEHECRSWESIVKWSTEHSVELQGPILQHPGLGIVYPTD